MPFLATVSKRIKYRTVEYVKSKTIKDYRSALVRVMQIYKEAGFKVTTISADREFVPLLEDMKIEHNFKPNYANAQEHVPEAEQNI